MEMRAGQKILEFLRATDEKMETKYAFLDFYAKSK
jgi:hypothetical protein